MFSASVYILNYVLENKIFKLGLSLKPYPANVENMVSFY
jgi:hypothetical protein